VKKINKENKYEKWLGRPELEMTLFSLTLSPDFLMTLLFFLFLTNTGILGMIGLRKL
jgi:hypothetical protein